MARLCCSSLLKYGKSTQVAKETFDTIPLFHCFSHSKYTQQIHKIRTFTECTYNLNHFDRSLSTYIRFSTCEINRVRAK